MSENKHDFNRFCELVKEWDNIEELPDGIQNEEERWDYVFVYLGWNRKDKLCFIANMLINMAYNKKPAEKTEIYDEICATMKEIANEKDSGYGEFLKRVVREQIKFVMESLVELGFPSFLLTHFSIYIRKEFAMNYSMLDLYRYNEFLKDIHKLFPESEDLPEEKAISFGYIADSFMEKYNINLKQTVADEGPAGNGISLLFDFCKNPDDFVKKYIPYVTDIPMSCELVKDLKGDEADSWLSDVFVKVFDYMDRTGGSTGDLKASPVYGIMSDIVTNGKASEEAKEKFRKI